MSCIGKRDKNQTPSEGANLELSEYDLKDGDVIKLSNTVFQVSIKDPYFPSSTYIIPQQIDPNLPSIVQFDRRGDLGSIKGYTKIKLLGKGGFGEVYLARFRDATGTKLVALKLLLPKVAVKPQMKQRFLGEARKN